MDFMRKKEGRRFRRNRRPVAIKVFRCFCSNYLQSSLANASSWALLASFKADLIVTVVSVNVRFLLFSKSPRMTLAATGIQLPFSIKATVRFWKLRSVRCVMNVCMKGKISALYVVVASTSLPYWNAASTADTLRARR